MAAFSQMPHTKQYKVFLEVMKDNPELMEAFTTKTENN
jgi:hypothetical protein